MRVPGRIAALASTLLAPAALAAPPEPNPCGSILPLARSVPVRRALVPEDLVRLRDIGPAEPQYFAAPFFTLSPDGREAAFQLRQADPKTNSYCLAMVIFDLLRPGPPRIIDEGGDPLLLKIDLWGIEIPNGVMKVVTPRWSADGKWIAFLKRSGGVTQVWRAFVDGSGSGPMTRSSVDIIDFRIAPDGSSIIYATSAGVERKRLEIQEQGLNGWHYDDRFAPWLSKAPMVTATDERKVEVMDIASGRLRTPTAGEAAPINSDHDFDFAVPAPASGSETLGSQVTKDSAHSAAGTLQARLADGTIAVCGAAACRGAMHPWWMPGRTHVRFIRWEGWGNASTAIYDWDLRADRVRRLYLTDDLLSSCTPRGRLLICLIDSSLAPRRLVRLDPATGKRSLLFDPNPEFARLTLGQPQRLHWRNAAGIETVGDLVLPVDYRPGKRYPMVVVQYDTRGFLRGGTNDEYPIQAFANRGYAVLSFKRPAFVSEARHTESVEQSGRLDLDQFADRRSVQSSLERGVQLSVERGVDDPRRIGITGLSDGTSTVEWALIHSSLFSAAAISSCCWEPTLVAEAGPAAARHFLAEGYPGILQRDDRFWNDVSLLANARRLATPILVNAAEEEVRNAVLAYTGLREAGVPIDMFVYPGEYHARWQPAHRLATYRRSLDWFDFWMRGIRSNAPDRRVEIERWDELRSAAAHRSQH